MSKKILVAEDSSVIQNLTKKILTLQNYQISAVKNGKQVIDKLGNEAFDLILMDIHMPQMDGMECARTIRQMTGDIANIPIIAITGNANNYSMDDFKEAGINEFIPKPLNYDNLVTVVNNYLANGN
ncbi:MAG: histidine kinase [Flammeovirgaceae bacterium]|nr:histidine kinase [Flammeovirgaceae bacterium]MBR06425.1 histidine kinase [Rickettsiales bacterium]HCX21233.1 histidine kinase [Cytophagales bacterium]|tara:strand:- start:19 stop:396 length:378 start_codon:yes stop_codon:yes gene_type:complete